MTSDLALRIANTVSRTRAEGPGERFALWVQGCTIRCTGCFNPHMWASRGGHQVTVPVLAEQILAADVEGVTFLGGEPFQQATALGALAVQVRAAGLSVMTFTGYTYDHLNDAATHDDGVRSLLDATDLLVDGPYLASHPDPIRPWVGSTNQNFRFLTDRYRHLEGTLALLADRIEVRVAPDGTAAVNGWASVEALDALLDGIGRTPVQRGSIR